MSLLGIDAGTTGCKAVVFSTSGQILASAYEEYNYLSAEAGWAELDAAGVWELVKRCIQKVTSQTKSDPVTALAVSSLGEAVVPVNRDRLILSPSLLNFDVRGEEYLDRLHRSLEAEYLYRVNGNTLGNQYSLTKLMWIRDHQPEIYTRTHKFLHWSSFISYLLGGDPVVDYSLANRSLLFDIERTAWSDQIMGLSGIDPEKLPGLAPSGTAIGSVSRVVGNELGLSPHVTIVTGSHDQCANAVGCGVITEGQAVYGMGTYHVITPVLDHRREPHVMMAHGLNTEHHAVPGRYVSFIFNHGGSLVKWYRNTFAPLEHKQALATGEDVYPSLLAEMPNMLSSVMVLPHFAPTGPPDFLTDTCGVITGLHLDTQRGDILKGIIEGITFYLMETAGSLEDAGILIRDYRVSGGGSKSDAWIQICADILGCEFTRSVITEASAVGAALMAGVGSGVFASFQEGVGAMVKLERTFQPDPIRHLQYQVRFGEYQQLNPALKGLLQEQHKNNHSGSR